VLENLGGDTVPHDPALRSHYRYRCALLAWRTGETSRAIDLFLQLGHTTSLAYLRGRSILAVASLGQYSREEDQTLEVMRFLSAAAGRESTSQISRRAALSLALIRRARGELDQANAILADLSVTRDGPGDFALFILSQ
jgi:hypothetical protein